MKREIYEASMKEFKDFWEPYNGWKPEEIAEAERQYEEYGYVYIEVEDYEDGIWEIVEDAQDLEDIENGKIKTLDWELEHSVEKEYWDRYAYEERYGER